MNRSWVRFPQAAQKRPPLQGWALSSMYEAWAESAGERAVGLGVPSCGRTWLRVPGLGFAPCHYRGWAAWCARGRRPARSPSAPRASLGASARCPARPCHHRQAPLQGPPTPSTPVPPGLLIGVARCFEARVGTASTHRHGSRTPLPRCRLFLSGVTPFSWVLHQFPGGVMLPKWCNAP